MGKYVGSLSRDGAFHSQKSVSYISDIEFHYLMLLLPLRTCILYTKGSPVFASSLRQGVFIQVSAPKS